MKSIALTTKFALALAIGGLVAAGPVFAEKPSWAGSGKDGKEQRKDHKGEQERAAAAQRHHFDEQHRLSVRQYYDEHYGEQYRGRRCPPGLAKKHNGCMPPGQAKKWEVGQPLPTHVAHHNVPQALVTQIGTPPAGQRYVRVGGDVLLVSNRTGLVLDAIQNLGR